MAATVTYLESNEMQKARAFSPAVITEGGKTVWLAGQTTTTDLETIHHRVYVRHPTAHAY